VKDLLKRFVVGVIAAVVVFGLYRTGIYLNSLMTAKTPLYFTVHHYLSIAVSAMFGLYAAASCNEIL
jgi:hypothetical protein